MQKCCHFIAIIFRSAHGFSDTDMATLLEQLQRESDDLCGHRGLQPGSDHQVTVINRIGRLQRTIKQDIYLFYDARKNIDKDDMTDFIVIVTFCKRAPKATKYLGNFCKKIVTYTILKIPQSEHTDET